MAVINEYASKRIRDNLLFAENKMKFSHKVDRKINRGVSKQTIYSTRSIEGKDMVVDKKNIYSDADYLSLKKIIDADLIKNPESKDSVVLMRRHDPMTFDILLKTIDTYKEAKNPFIKAREDGFPLRKFSKKNNGPEITFVKYLKEELGSCIDVSHKYNVDDKKVVLLSLNPYRADVFFDKAKGIYRVIGIKYADFKYSGGKYILDMDRYKAELVREKVVDKPGDFDLRLNNDLLFKFSLYKNDLITFGENKECAGEYRFLSRSMPKAQNYIEVKPINKARFEKQMLIGVGKNVMFFKKINTDILGNKHYISQETFIIDFNID